MDILEHDAVQLKIKLENLHSSTKYLRMFWRLSNLMPNFFEYEKHGLEMYQKLHHSISQKGWTKNHSVIILSALTLKIFGAQPLKCIPP